MGQVNLDFSVGRAARATDPETSRLAAEQIAPHVTEGQMLTLKAFYFAPDAPLDDFQLSDLTGLRQTSVGKRRCELERAGYVEKAGRRVSPSPQTSSVVQSYRITEAGLTFYAREVGG
jgi:hypothetical protein